MISKVVGRPVIAVSSAVLLATILAGSIFAMDDYKPRTKVRHIASDFEVGELDDPRWSSAKVVKVKDYWSGKKAPKGRRFEARLLWSDAYLYVRFEAAQSEPVVANGSPDLTREAEKLWERDVCEIFIAPDRVNFRYYFEFEVAPTGEWLDLKIHQKPDERITDWEYSSGMKTAARIEKESVVMAIKVPWSSMGAIPSEGDVWVGNLFRAVGSGESRGYLAWSPTLTPEPNFHRPDMFGEFEFVGQ
ncbi:MAG: carbohydrate-binding family 9-like protein [Aridibacter famidurans]|nr:carbohydrate-binding family 9-like protein [Aridibacter famidurans]